MRRVLLRGGRLIDGINDEPIDDAYVAWEGERITSVGAVRDISDAMDWDEVIESHGKTIIPGMVNAHEHLDDRRTYGPYHERVTRPPEILLLGAVRAAFASLQEGITTVRDVGSHHLNSVYLKHAVELGVLVGPRVRTCIAPISQTGSAGLPTSIPVSGPVAASGMARELIARGADFIKCQASAGAAGAAAGGPTGTEMTLEELEAVFDEVHRQGKQTTVHAHPPPAIKQAIQAGVDAVEHGCLIDDATADLMVANEVALVCTLSEFDVTAREGLSYRRPTLQVERNAPVAEAAVVNFRRAVRAGVKIAWGLDVLGNPVREFELMMQGGMTAMQALQSATRVGAEVLQMADDIGSLTPGKYADIVVLDGDPLTTPRALAAVDTVIIGGRRLTRSSLDSVTAAQLPGYLIDHGRLLEAHEY